MSGCYLQNILYTPKNAAKLLKGHVPGHIQQEDFKKNTNSPAIQPLYQDAVCCMAEGCRIGAGPTRRLLKSSRHQIHSGMMSLV